MGVRREGGGIGEWRWWCSSAEVSKAALPILNCHDGASGPFFVGS